MQEVYIVHIATYNYDNQDRFITCEATFNYLMEHQYKDIEDIQPHSVPSDPDNMFPGDHFYEWMELMEEPEMVYPYIVLGKVRLYDRNC